MPRPSKRARPFKPKPRYRGRKLIARAVWFRDDITAGCLTGTFETKAPREAEQALDL